jgi:hypothetical protein
MEPAMPPVTIDNPILNSPYREPTRHFRFDANDQITDIGDVRAPYLVRPLDAHAPQQIRVDPLPRPAGALLRLGVDRLQTHDPH